jgi:hypothetical protein
METITLDKIEYIIKTNWEELSVNDYWEIIELLKSNILSDEQKYAGILGYALNRSMEDVEKMNLDHFMKLIPYLKFIQEQPQTVNIPSLIIINGKLFKINLNPKTFSTEKYLNIITYMKGKDEREKNINVLSSLIIPAKYQKRFYKTEVVELESTEYNLDEHIEFIKNNISITLGNSIIVFFYHLLKYLMRVSIICLDKQITRMTIRLNWKKKLKILKPKESAGLDALIELRNKLEEVGKMYTEFQL